MIRLPHHERVSAAPAVVIFYAGRRAGCTLFARRALLSGSVVGLLIFGIAPARSAELPDLLAPLPLGTDYVTQMQRELGRDARVLQTDHFVLVHTLADDAAGELGTRLEAVYRANARLLRGLRIPVKPPRHKLAVLVFGTYERFRAAAESGLGGRGNAGVLRPVGQPGRIL